METIRNAIRALAGAAALGLLAGCVTPLADPYTRADTPVHPGAVLVLDERLPLPAADARVYFQGGAVTRFHDRDRFAPWCSIGVRRGDDGELPGAVEAGRFTLTGVRHGAQADAAGAGALRVAGRSLAWAGIDRGGGLGHLTWTLTMRLDAPAQPSVHGLRCAIDRPGDWRGRLGLESVRVALGELGRLLPRGE